MKRREFIKTTGAAGAYVGLGSLGLSSFTTAETKQITIFGNCLRKAET